MPSPVPDLKGRLGLLSRLQADQSERWARGERVPLEVYVQQHAELAGDPEVLLALLCAEVLLRRENGDTPNVDEYLARFPQHADRIRQIWGAHDFIVRQVLHGPATTGSHRITDPAGPGGQRPLPALPGYEVLQELGRGGMGVVFKARQVAFDRLVAVKMIRSQILAGPDELARFRTEALAVGRLDHPHVVRVHAFGEEQDCPYFVMEYLPGGSLAGLLRRGPLEVRRAAELVRQVARGVQAAHEAGVLHRDLKPGNVLLDAEDNARVADFGLAKLLDADSGQTASAAVLGTPSYMAPEQAGGCGRAVGPATDVWALGVILYEGLTGELPFRGSTREETLRRVQTADPVTPRRLRAEVPPELEAICLKGLQKNPVQRYVGAGELADDIDRFLAGQPVTAGSRRWYDKAWRRLRSHPLLSTLAVLVMLLVVVAAWLLERLDPDRLRKKSEAALARGEAYTFEGHEPLPGPFRWVLGDPGPPKANVLHRCVTIETLGLGLLELVRDPGCDHYRVLLEIRHDGDAGVSAVGLYFGYRDDGAPPGQRKGCFYSLSFADRGADATIERDSKGNAVSHVVLRCHCFFTGPRGLSDPTGRIARGKPFRPDQPLARPGPWRTLVLEVSPREVKAFWAPEGTALDMVAQVSVPDLEMHTSIRKRSYPELRDVPTTFQPQSGLGVYVLGGRASFRRLVLTPVPNHRPAGR